MSEGSLIQGLLNDLFQYSSISYTGQPAPPPWGYFAESPFHIFPPLLLLVY